MVSMTLNFFAEKNDFEKNENMNEFLLSNAPIIH